jgi:hypothetical protein
MKCADAALLQASSLLGIDPPSDDRPVRGTAAEPSGEAASAAVGAEPPLLTSVELAQQVKDCATSLQKARERWDNNASEQGAFEREVESAARRMHALSERVQSSKARIVFECQAAGCLAFFNLDSAHGVSGGHGIVRCPRCWSTSVRVGLRPNVRKAGVA